VAPTSKPRPKHPPLVRKLCRALVELMGDHAPTMYWLSIDRVRDRLDVSIEKVDAAVTYAVKANLVLADSLPEPHSLTVTHDGWGLAKGAR
jgi:hypothetical protein